MAKHYRGFIRGTNWALAGLLGLFGLGCSEEEGGGWAEYGTPTAKYSIKGKVLDKKTIDPIPDIQVIVEFEPGEEWAQDTVYTNRKGEFEISRHVGYMREVIRLISSDEKELFLPDTLNVSFEDVPLTGKEGAWYMGEAEQEVTIHLEKNEKEEEPED